MRVKEQRSLYGSARCVAPFAAEQLSCGRFRLHLTGKGEPRWQQAPSRAQFEALGPLIVEAASSSTKIPSVMAQASNFIGMGMEMDSAASSHLHNA